MVLDTSCMTICAFNQTFQKAAKMTRNMILASSAFYWKWPSLTSVDGSHEKWKGSWTSEFSVSHVDISFQGCWVRGEVLVLGAHGAFSMLSPSAPSSVLSWNKPAEDSKQREKQRSPINRRHICKCVCLKSARKLAQCPISRLGNCLLRLVPLLFL